MGDDQTAADGGPIVPLIDGTTETADDSERYIEFTAHQCRTCGEHGPFVRTVRDGIGRIVQYSMWDVQHNRATGHRKYFQYSAQRSHSTLYKP